MKKKLCIFVVLMMIISFPLCSCGSNVVFSSSISGDVMVSYGSGTLTDRQVKLIALNYKNEYENYYGDLLGLGFWNQKVTDDLSFEAYIKEYYLWSECEYLTELQKVSEKLDISLTEEEEKNSDSKAREYFDHLTEDEKKYTQIDLSQTKDLFCKYQIAEKTIQFLLKDVITEVSDEDSRMMDIQVLHVASLDFANELKTRIDAGESFADLAEENTLDLNVSYSVGRGDLCEPFDSTIFSMEEGQVSDVISFQNTYYIIRCNNIFNTLYSQLRKSELLMKKEFLDWDAIALKYLEGKSPARNEYAWDKISLQGEGDYSHFDLFDYIEN